MRAALQVTSIFGAVGLGALVVTLLYDPGALIPHPPYGDWIIGRAFAIGALFSLGLLLVLGLEDGFDDTDLAGAAYDPVTFRRALPLAFLISALSAGAFIAASALTH